MQDKSIKKANSEYIFMILTGIKEGLLSDNNIIRQRGYKINNIKVLNKSKESEEYSIICELVENFRDMNRPNIICITNIEFLPNTVCLQGDNPINMTIYYGDKSLDRCSFICTGALESATKAKLFSKKVKAKINRVLLKVIEEVTNRG